MKKIRQSFFFATCLAALTACGTSLPAEDTANLETQAIRKPKPPAPTPSITNTLYSMSIQRNGKIINPGFFYIYSQTNSGQPSEFASSLGVYTPQFQNFFSFDAATIASWSSFVHPGIGYFPENTTYSLPALTSLATDGTVKIFVGSPDPNSLAAGIRLLSLVGKLQADGRIVGTPGVPTSSNTEAWVATPQFKF